jgi:hypothetical protein
MMLLTKALLVLKMVAAAAPAGAPGLPAYEQCSEAQECGSGLVCDGGLCTPTLNCETASDCPEAPEAYSVVCIVLLTCEGSFGVCHLAPGQYEECPEGLINATGPYDEEICVGS